MQVLFQKKEALLTNKAASCLENAPVKGHEVLITRRVVVAFAKDGAVRISSLGESWDHVTSKGLCLLSPLNRLLWGSCTT